MKKLIFQLVALCLYVGSVYSEIVVTITDSRTKIEVKGNFIPGFKPEFDYAVDDKPYQSDPIFEDIKPGSHRARVKVRGSDCEFFKNFTVNGKCCFQGEFFCGPQVTEEKCMRSAEDGEKGQWLGTTDACGESPCGAKLLNVELPSLQSRYDEVANSMTLHWEEYSSEVINGYYLQRSRDGLKFKTIGFIKKNFENKTPYSFEDINPYRVGYYRLLWFSNSNKFTSHAICAILEKTTKVIIVPNPAVGRIAFMFTNMSTSLTGTETSVYDLSGKLKIYHKYLPTEKPELNISTLSRGTYIIKIRQNDQLLTQKLIKL